MVKQFLPTQLKNQLKKALGIRGIHDRINHLESTLHQEQALKIIELNDKINRLENTVAQHQQEVKRLQELYKYSVLKEVDLIRYYGSLYFWYTQDISYQWISRSPEPLVIKNYTPSAEDFNQSYLNSGDILQDYNQLSLNDPHLHEYELKHILFLHLWLNDIDFVFIDIGANYGNTAIPAAKFFKKYGQKNPIISFEPGFVYELFQHNTKINQVSDIIQPEKIAISDKNYPLVIKSMSEHSECNSVQDLRQFYPDLQLASCQVVESARLEDYIKQHQITSPLLVKIDAEGSDFQVLEGMKSLLNNGVVMLILEYDPKYLNRFISSETILKDLSQDYLLFNMRTLDQNTQWQFSKIEDSINSLKIFSQAVLDSPAGWTDVLAVSKSLPNLDKLIKRMLG